MEWLVILIFLLLLIGMGRQVDNPEVPYTPSTKPSLEELYADLPDIPLKQIDLVSYIKANKRTYLASPQWQTLRKVILKRDSYTCQGCGIDGVPLEIHHITYVRFEEELESDLVAVCRDCHQAIHDKHGYNYLNTFPLERQ